MFLENYLQTIFSNPLFLISITIIIGLMLNKISIKGFRLGASGILFAGIFIAEILVSKFKIDYQIPSEVFKISLIGFIVVVGLFASANLVPIVKQHGVKFIILSFVVTIPSVILVLIANKIYPNLLYELAGSYVGSLTSSPGLANALELAKPVNMTANVGLGYAVAYLPGVVSVIMFGQFYAKKVGRERKQNLTDEVIELEIKEDKFDAAKFILVVAVGIAIGHINVPLGSVMKINFGITGGCLISALLFGSFAKGYNMEEEKLAVIKTISLYMFLAIIGLRYGHKAVSSLASQGKIIFPFAILSANSAILAGYYFGKKVLKMEPALLAGAICGAMTSTPGLAATYKAFDDKRVVTGYGATYPFGLILKILFIKVLI